MTPKERAQKLINKYTLLVPIEFGGMHIDLAKECSIVAVDEILDMLIGSLITIEYWQEVKHEINQL